MNKTKFLLIIFIVVITIGVWLTLGKQNKSPESEVVLEPESIESDQKAPKTLEPQTEILGERPFETIIIDPVYEGFIYAPSDSGKVLAINLPGAAPGAGTVFGSLLVFREGDGLLFENDYQEYGRELPGLESGKSEITDFVLLSEKELLFAASLQKPNNSPLFIVNLDTLEFREVPIDNEISVGNIYQTKSGEIYIENKHGTFFDPTETGSRHTVEREVYRLDILTGAVEKMPDDFEISEQSDNQLTTFWPKGGTTDEASTRTVLETGSFRIYNERYKFPESSDEEPVYQSKAIIEYR